MNRRLHSSILDVRSITGADCYADNHLAVPEVWERLAVGKRAVQKMDMERFSLKNLNERKLKTVSDYIQKHFGSSEILKRMMGLS
jgi:hypothetical protein